MGENMVVHRVAPDAEAETLVAERLSAAGIKIVRQERLMFLVSGDRDAVARALGASHGWGISPVTTTPPPKTREQVLKPP